MRRSVAASTIQAVLGPRQKLVGQFAQAGNGRGTSKGRILNRRHDQITGRMQSGAADFFISRTYDNFVYRPASRFRAPCQNRSACPARFCSSIMTCSMMCAGQVPSRTRCRNPPCSPTPHRCSISAGSHDRQALVKSGHGIGRMSPPGRQYQPRLQEPDGRSIYSVHARGMSLRNSIFFSIKILKCLSVDPAIVWPSGRADVFFGMTQKDRVI